jgi:phosphatidylinositol alpha-1,6-mannosyltransferase
VDTDVFSPHVDGSVVRRRLAIADGRPVVVAASRLVRRKGHDVLVAAWPAVLTTRPDAVLLIVGDGPARRRLDAMVTRQGLADSVRFVTDAGWGDMPQIYAAGDVFAQPCRTRLRGLEPEALGIVFLEAAASAKPVVVGRSGGAPETVVDGRTGYVVDPRSVDEVAARICELLADPDRARRMGECGRARVATAFSWETAVATARRLLGIGTDETDGKSP